MLVLSNKTHLEIRHKIFMIMIATWMIVSIYQQFFVRYASIMFNLIQFWPLVLFVWMEVVIYYEFIQVFLPSIRHKFRTPILECEIIQTDRPSWITVINIHQILFELFHGLGQQCCCSFMFFRLFFGSLVIFSQAIVQLEIADEFESGKQMFL